MTKVSVLVPIYNVAKFLPECLQSLVSQTLKDIEIICINDGSTDESPKIIKRFTKKYPQIVVIDKKNSGYGDSMNRGLEKAKGEYIAIVESDDYVEADMCEKLYALAKQHKADIVRANYYHHTNEGDVIHHAIKNQKLEKPQTIYDDMAILYDAPAIWSAIYRKKFLEDNQIKFLPTPGASYQDTSFNIKALCSAKKIIYTDKAYLHYRTDNGGSSMKNREKMEFVVKEYKEAEEYLVTIKAKTELLETMQAVKFGAYHWNLLRLSRPLAIEFLKIMKREFSGVQLNKEYFPKKYWNALRIILKFPPWVYYSMIFVRKIIKRG